MASLTLHTAPAASDDLVGLPEAAEFLGLHRATVNEMVKTGRIQAERDGAHWFIRRGDLTAFKASYRRPPNSPRRPPRNSQLPATAVDILARLGDWGDATVAELGEVLDVHEGTVRKNLSILQARGLAHADDHGSWRPTASGIKHSAVASA